MRARVRTHEAGGRAILQPGDDGSAVVTRVGLDVVAPEDEVAEICQELIRIDTSNYGDGSGPGERAAAEYVAELLDEVGLEPVLLESAPGRANVVVRLPGADRTRPGLIMHGHLDVVPADAGDWEIPPFSGEVHEGAIWGRGAVDMKGMVAMLVANMRYLKRTGQLPPRDIVFAFFADEEAGGAFGARWLVENHAELFEGCNEAVSEVGGFSVTLPVNGGENSARAYLLQAAEKGVLWLRLVARGRAGHGSVPHDENAVVRLSQAVTRINAHVWPQEFIASVTQLLEGVSDITGIPMEEGDPRPILSALGGVRRFVEGTVRNTANATMLEGGYKHNVVPQTATAALDCRFLPGREQQLLNTIKELAGHHVDVQVVHRDVALEAEFDRPLVTRMKRALQAEDPDAHVLPYCLSGGTDNKHLSTLGITGYGFVPLRLPPDLDFAGMFHGINERIPVDSLRFGTRVLQRFISDC